MPSLHWKASDSSFDEEHEQDKRAQLHWPSYRALLKLRGFHLDTVRDAKAFYTCSADGQIPEYFLLRHAADDDDALCPDAGLVGTRTKPLPQRSSANLHSPIICFEVNALATASRWSSRLSICTVVNFPWSNFCPRRHYETIQ